MEQILAAIPGVAGVTSPIAVALAMVYLIFTGKLYVRSAHEAVVRVLEAQIKAITEDRDVWRTSSIAKDATVASLTATNARFIQSAEFQDHVMSALQESTTGGAQ